MNKSYENELNAWVEPFSFQSRPSLRDAIMGGLRHPLSIKQMQLSVKHFLLKRKWRKKKNMWYTKRVMGWVYYPNPNNKYGSYVTCDECGVSGSRIYIMPHDTLDNKLLCEAVFWCGLVVITSHVKNFFRARSFMLRGSGKVFYEKYPMCQKKLTSCLLLMLRSL